MLHLGTFAFAALFTLCSAAAPFSLAGTENDQPEPVVAYENTDTVDAEWEAVDIPYTSKTLTGYYSLSMMYPNYNFSPAVGSCGSIAGANVLGFYDRYYEELIPDHAAGTLYDNNLFLYNIEDSAVIQVIRTLYEYMGTEHVGTTEDEFLDGMRRYCSEKGRTISFTSCMSSKSFNYTTAQQKMRANQPIILFLSGYNAAMLTTSENADTVHYLVSDVGHIMIGFGYQIYTYTTSSGTRTDEYINVSTGLSSNTRMLFDINYKTKIDDALAVNIY